MTILQDILNLFSTQFEKACANDLILNELGSTDDSDIIYTAGKFSFAGTSSSDYSFGFNQIDLGRNIKNFIKYIFVFLIIFTILIQTNSAIASEKTNIDKNVIDCLDLKNGYELSYNEYLTKLKNHFDVNDFNNIKEILDKKESLYSTSYKNFSNICKIKNDSYFFFKDFPEIGSGIFIISKDNNIWHEKRVSYESQYISNVFDKKGNQFLLISSNSLIHGLASEEYSIMKIINFEITKLLNRDFDGESGLCGRKSLNIKISTDLKYKIKDENKDGYGDIVFDIKEQNCKTNKIKKYRRIFYATDNGFKEIIKNNK